MRGVWLRPTKFVAQEHLKKTFVSHLFAYDVANTSYPGNEMWPILAKRWVFIELCWTFYRVCKRGAVCRVYCEKSKHVQGLLNTCLLNERGVYEFNQGFINIYLSLRVWIAFTIEHALVILFFKILLKLPYCFCANSHVIVFCESIISKLPLCLLLIIKE